MGVSALSEGGGGGGNGYRDIEISLTQLSTNYMVLITSLILGRGRREFPSNNFKHNILCG